MVTLRSPKNKLILAVAALALLLLVPTMSGATQLSRWALLAAAGGGLAFWLWRARAAASNTAAPRLQVISRTGLSARSGVALIEVDGRSLLIVHGEGFAHVCQPDGSVAPLATPLARLARRGHRKAVRR